MPTRRARTWLARIAMWSVRIVFAVILAFPFYWMLITTFKRNTDLNNLQHNPFIFNEPPTLDHLKLLFQETMFPRWVLNTAFAGLIGLMIPMSTSGILTVVIFAFTLVTQEFVYALTFISSAAHQTVGVGVPTFLVRGDVYYWGSLMAACLITSLPIGILYNLFLDRFIEGFTVGAVK